MEGDLFDLLTLVWFADKVLGKKPKFKKVVLNPVPFPKSFTPFDDNFSNLGDAIELEESCDDIGYFIGDDEDDSDDGVNFCDFVAFAANLFMAIFENCKKMYR